MSIDIYIDVNVVVNIEPHSTFVSTLTIMRRRVMSLCTYVGIDVDVERSFHCFVSILASMQMKSVDIYIVLIHISLCISFHHRFPSSFFSSPTRSCKNPKRSNQFFLRTTITIALVAPVKFYKVTINIVKYFIFIYVRILM